MLIKQLFYNDYEQISEIAKTRDTYFKDQPFDPNIYLAQFQDRDYYSKNKVVFGGFNNGVMERFIVLYLFDHTSVIGMSISRKDPNRPKNQAGWSADHSAMLTHCIQTSLNFGFDSFWTLTPDKFRPNEDNPDAPIFKDFEVVYYEKIFPGDKSESPWVYQYVSEAGIYNNTTIAKKYKYIKNLQGLANVNN